MRRRISLLLLLAGILIAASCTTKPADTASSGANPPIGNPVGPLPGVTTQPLGATNPYASDHIAIAQGRQAFIDFNCYGCHGGHAGGGMGPSLRDPVWIYGSTDADIFNSIAQGRGKGMPAWGTRLTGDQIWKLVAYIKTLRTPMEADPPPPEQ